MKLKVYTIGVFFLRYIKKISTCTSSIVPCKVLVNEKFDPDGLPEKWKARVVAGGHQQHIIEGEDNSAPTVRTPSVMAVLALGALVDPSKPPLMLLVWMFCIFKCKNG